MYYLVIFYFIFSLFFKSIKSTYSKKILTNEKHATYILILPFFYFAHTYKRIHTTGILATL
jgi:hypothetical protein